MPLAHPRFPAGASSRTSALPPGDRTALSKILLQINFHWETTGGTRMASNGPGGEVVQVHEIAVDGLDATRLSAMLPSFADGTRAWRKRIQRPAAAQANLDISDGQESNRHSMGKGTDVPSPRSLAKRDSVDNSLSEGPGDLDEVDPHLDGLVRKGLVDERKTRIQTLGQGLKEGVFVQQSTDGPHGGQSAAVTTAKTQTPNLNELFRN